MSKFILSMISILIGIIIGVSMVHVIIIKDDGTVCAEIK